jgi:hypothetical protein
MFRITRHVEQNKPRSFVGGLSESLSQAAARVDDLTAIARLIDALEPWLPQLVIVGGWAHQLHRLHPDAGHPKYAPLRTRDADLAFSLHERLAGNIAAALKAADFVEEFSSDFTPPIAQYHLGREDEGFYAEFLTPLEGDGRNRDGTPSETIAKAGITAQKLRHLDLLLIEPWTFRVDHTVGIPVSRAIDVRIANPIVFIAQKLLIQKQRKPRKRAQDVLYIHDTLELFSGHLEQLRSSWKERLRTNIPRKTAQRIERLSAEQFSVVTDIIRDAARIPSSRRLTPEQLQVTCAYGLGEIFGK